MSSNGVPSSVSTPSMDKMFSCRDMSRTVDMPIGFGRYGYRVAKIPCSWSSKKGILLIFYYLLIVYKIFIISTINSIREEEEGEAASERDAINDAIQSFKLWMQNSYGRIYDDDDDDGGAWKWI